MITHDNSYIIHHISYLFISPHSSMNSYQATLPLADSNCGTQKKQEKNQKNQFLSSPDPFCEPWVRWSKRPCLARWPPNQTSSEDLGITWDNYNGKLPFIYVYRNIHTWEKKRFKNGKWTCQFLCLLLSEH